MIYGGIFGKVDRYNVYLIYLEFVFAKFVKSITVKFMKI